MPTYRADFFTAVRHKINTALRRARGGPIAEADLVGLAQVLIEHVRADIASRGVRGQQAQAAVNAALAAVAPLAGSVGIMDRVRNGVLPVAHAAASAPTVGPSMASAPYWSPKEILEEAVETHFGTLEALATAAGVEPRILYRIRQGQRVNDLADRERIAAAVAEAGIECCPGALLNPTTNRGRGRPPKERS